MHLFTHAHASPSIDGEPLAQDPVMVDVDIVAGSSFSKLELLFQSHETNVDAAKCSKSACPACHASGCFTRKDTRRRKLRYVRQHPVTSILHVAKIAKRTRSPTTATQIESSPANQSGNLQLRTTVRNFSTCTIEIEFAYVL